MQQREEQSAFRYKERVASHSEASLRQVDYFNHLPRAVLRADACRN